MDHRIKLCLLACVGLTPGCFQEFESRAASGGSLLPDATAVDEASSPCPPGSNPETSDLDPSGGTILCSDPSSPIDTPTLITRLPVLLQDGGTSMDVCDSIRPAAMAIRTTFCSPCHAPPNQISGGFNYVLDDQKLITSHSVTKVDANNQYLRMIIPGNPDSSWVYMRIQQGLAATPGVGMPPILQGVPTSAQPRRPTGADLSFLRSWILSCLGSDPLSDGGPASDAAAADGGDAAPGEGGSNDASSGI
jgi:hypothetical protein